MSSGAIDRGLSWAGGLFSEYVLPYWPWILGIVLGAMVLRFVMRRILSKVWALVGAALLGGSTFGGLGTWLSDRGAGLVGSWWPW